MPAHNIVLLLCGLTNKDLNYLFVYWLQEVIRQTFIESHTDSNTRPLCAIRTTPFYSGGGTSNRTGFHSLPKTTFSHYQF
jgi:hypothetical protein